MNIYYKLWVDLIKRASSLHKSNWKIGCMIGMSMSMAFNLVLLMMLLQQYVFRSFFYHIEFPSFPPLLSHVSSFLLIFVLPCVIINYLLIFRNNRYENLLKEYSYYQGKLFIIYFICSMFLPVLLLWIAILLR